MDKNITALEGNNGIRIYYDDGTVEEGFNKAIDIKALDKLSLKELKELEKILRKVK